MLDTEKEALCARIDELCAEVEALKREKPRTLLSVTARHVAELQAENAKLRELVRGLWYCTENENKAMCEGCPLGVVEGNRLALSCERRMYELGIEVDG